MKSKLFLILFVISLCANAQKLNKYKYVIVSHKIDFFNKADKYQTSSLTKFLFNENGFTAFLSNETLPKDFNTNRCSALFASLVKSSSMFVIKTAVQLKDCNNKIIYTSRVGRSKEKDYKKGYHQSIRRAFEDFEFKNYKYKPKLEVVNEPKIKKITKPKKGISILYAQVKENGFQLVDTTPKIIFTILKTTIKNVFLLKNKNGIFYRKNKNWFVEYYENNNLIKEEFQVKF